MPKHGGMACIAPHRRVRLQQNRADFMILLLTTGLAYIRKLPKASTATPAALFPPMATSDLDKAVRQDDSAKSSNARSRSISSPPARPPMRCPLPRSTSPAASPSATRAPMSTEDECGAVGISHRRLAAVPDRRRADGKMDPAALEKAIAEFPREPSSTAASRWRITITQVDRSRAPSIRSTKSRRSAPSPRATACRCTWTARALPMRWCRSAARLPK